MPLFFSIYSISYRSEQLLKFLVQNSPDPNDTSTSSNPADSSDQGSLYQMLQEYMVENQHLKEENENLKVERSDFVEKLEREKTTNEKITREVSNAREPSRV